MPAGLDGDPDPIDSPQRRVVLDAVAEAVVAARAGRTTPLVVGVDGIDGAGKSTFGDELAAVLARSGLTVVRSTVDWFHRPRRDRQRRGPRSPYGFYADSHDLDRLTAGLLDPFRAGAGARYRVATFDEPSDEPLDPPVEIVAGDEVLVFDGIFLARPELVDRWDLLVFLDGQHRVELERLGLVMTDLPPDGPAAVAHVLDWVARIDRYSSGMRIYLDADHPTDRADLVIDNNDLARPRIVGP